MAESLAPVDDPLPTALRPGGWSSPGGVARSIAGALGFETASDAPPAWLRPAQVPSFRRVLAALRRHGGALLADPVGSGKTFVALAAATILNPRQPTACLVPATLVEQWRITADRLGVSLCLVSHEAASRGRLPDAAPGLVLIDEAHRFRHPQIRRYRRVAPWLVGRRVLLITATPVVNRLEDLLHLLLLAVRDDVLRADGVPSLRELLVRGAGSAALGRVIVEGRGDSEQPRRLGTASVPTEREAVAAADGLSALAELRLSRHPATAALVRSVLHRAAASSPAALAAALRRYRSLLLQARDARDAGHRLSRRELRRFTGKLEDQLVWWELLPGDGGELELELDDVAVIDAALAAGHPAEAAPDDKVERLRTLLADGMPSLIFTASRDTVRYLRHHLCDLPVAWCTGARAGLGHAVLPRRVVLGWFREGSGPEHLRPGRAHHLIVTDVAAEGLDLQRAARVVHYDLPWTPMRLDQREGRAIRLGSAHDTVTVVRFTPPAPLDRTLRLERTLARKAALPSTAGLGPAGRSLWRWRTELADLVPAGAATRGTAIVPGGPPGVLAGFSVHGRGGESETCLATAVVWIAPDGSWTDDEATIAARLGAALAVGETSPPSPAQLRRALVLLAGPIRSRLVLCRGSRWLATRLAPAARSMALQVQHELRAAARRRDGAAIWSLERALAFLGGGHTAGEAMLVERLAAMDEAELRRALHRLPEPSPSWSIIEPRLGGLLLFGGLEDDSTAVE